MRLFNYIENLKIIGEHSDKTIDITKNSVICNFSFGATRIIQFKKKMKVDEKYEYTKIPLPNDSLVLFDMYTNKNYKHVIRSDRRPESELTPEELLNNKMRISITFRSISTFVSNDKLKIFGQGAIYKTYKEMCSFLSENEYIKPTSVEDEVDLVKRFSDENWSYNKSWDDIWGKGSNVIEFSKLNK